MVWSTFSQSVNTCLTRSCLISTFSRLTRISLLHISLITSGIALAVGRTCNWSNLRKHSSKSWVRSQGLLISKKKEDVRRKKISWRGRRLVFCCKRESMLAYSRLGLRGKELLCHFGKCLLSLSIWIQLLAKRSFTSHKGTMAFFSKTSTPWSLAKTTIEMILPLDRKSHKSGARRVRSSLSHRLFSKSHQSRTTMLSSSLHNWTLLMKNLTSWLSLK